MIKPASEVRLDSELAIDKLYNNKWEVITGQIAAAIDATALVGKSRIAVRLTSSSNVYTETNDYDLYDHVVTSCDINATFHDKLVSKLHDLLEENGYEIHVSATNNKGRIDSCMIISWWYTWCRLLVIYR